MLVGVDVAETALSIARLKAATRGLDAEFVVADGLVSAGGRRVVCWRDGGSRGC
jgi:hypothetical protein